MGKIHCSAAMTRGTGAYGQHWGDRICRDEKCDEGALSGDDRGREYAESELRELRNPRFGGSKGWFGWNNQSEDNDGAQMTHFVASSVGAFSVIEWGKEGF